MPLGQVSNLSKSSRAVVFQPWPKISPRIIEFQYSFGGSGEN